MTALSAPTPRDPADVADPEALARRALRLDAMFCVLVGGTALVAARPIAVAVALPSGAVRAAAAGTLGWAGAVGLWSVAEEWQPPTRRVLGTNTAVAAALVGNAVVKGTPAGRIGLLGLAAAMAGLGAAQLKALLADQPEPSS